MKEKNVWLPVNEYKPEYVYEDIVKPFFEANPKLKEISDKIGNIINKEE